MVNPDNHDPQHDPGPRLPHWWKRLWPKAKVPLQLTAGQLIGWALRKWLGE